MKGKVISYIRLSNLTIRQQLIIGIALIHALLMSIFVVDLVHRQHKFLQNQSIETALSLSKTLGINSVSWVLSNDFIGMEEIVQSLKHYPEIKYAMLLSPDGKVLAHIEHEYTGYYVNDTISISLLQSKNAEHILVQNDKLIDVATPVLFSGKIIAWSRVAIQQEMIESGLRSITLDGIAYTILAILIGSIFAVLMSRGITGGLRHLVSVTEKVRRGDENTRVGFHRKDELGILGTNLNTMLDSLAQKKEEIERARQEIANSRDLAEKASSAKGLFLASMSHELKTPLNGILGFTQLIKKNKQLPPDILPGIEVIHKSAQHLLLLLSDILDFTKMESDTLVLKEETFYWQDFIQPIVELAKIQANQKFLDFIYQPDSNLPQVLYADKYRLKQVLLNLLTNALKFTEKGYIKLQVELQEFFSSDRTVVIEFRVLDTGIGIASDKQQIIFDPFQQISRAHQFIEGTGLGLSITRKIINLLESEIHVESPLPESIYKPEGTKGSVFYFTVKMKIAEAPFPNEIPDEPDFIPEYNPEFRKYDILVVDDNKSNRIVLCSFLESIGLNCVEAENAEKAIALCRQHKFHLLFVDLFMPEMSGCDLIGALEEKNLLQGKVVIHSAYADIKPIEKATCNGIKNAGFLGKPFTYKEVLDILQKHLHLTFTRPKKSLSGHQKKILSLPDNIKLKELLQYSKTGNITELKKAILSLLESDREKYAAFVHKISKYTEGFEFDKIESFLNTCINQTKSSHEK